jgi:hypothetical protein
MTYIILELFSAYIISDNHRTMLNVKLIRRTGIAERIFRNGSAIIGGKQSKKLAHLDVPTIKRLVTLQTL